MSWEAYLMRAILLMMLTFIFIPTIGHAEKHELEDLYIHTYIHEDGSATIRETRKATLSEGTENFLVIENIGKSEIRDFRVMEYGVAFEHVGEWDSSDSRADKALKQGIIITKDGYELVWGIGLYGEHEYIIEYRVTDFIKQLDDAQIIYWYFVSQHTNIPPQNVRIEIESAKDLSFNDEKIWAYGFDGDIQFQDGKVIAESKRPLAKSDYAVVLVKFDENAFATADVLDKSFSDIKKEADEGKGIEGTFTIILMVITSIGFVIVIRFVVHGFLSGVFRGVNKVKKLKKAPVKYEGQHTNELPYKGQLHEIYQLLADAKLSNLENLMGAYFLKWIKEKRIKIEHETVEGLFKRKQKVTIQILRKNVIDDVHESDLFSNLSVVADETGKVEIKELQKSVSMSRHTMKQWEQNVKNTSQAVLIEQGYFKDVVKFGLTGYNETYEKTEKGEQLEREIFLFKNYLRNLSDVDESNPNNAELLDEYMIWATFLGMTKEAQVQFTSLYADYMVYSMYRPQAIEAVVEISNSIAYASGAGRSFSAGGGGGAFGGGGGWNTVVSPS